MKPLIFDAETSTRDQVGRSARHEGLRKHFLHVFTPLFIGGVVYILWRSETLRMFRWFEIVGLHNAIHSLREMYGGQGDQLPAWLLYSFPDAAWAYSFSMHMGLLWINISPRLAFSLALIGPALGIGGEIGQACGIVPGTFDIADILLSATASVVSIMFLIDHKKGGLPYEAYTLGAFSAYLLRLRCFRRPGIRKQGR